MAALAGLGSALGTICGQQQAALQQYQWAETANSSSAVNYAINLSDYSAVWAAKVKPRAKSFGDEFGPLAREGDIESPLQWLDRRVNEMRVRL